MSFSFNLFVSTCHTWATVTMPSMPALSHATLLFHMKKALVYILNHDSFAYIHVRVPICIVN